MPKMLKTAPRRIFSYVRYSTESAPDVQPQVLGIDAYSRRLGLAPTYFEDLSEPDGSKPTDGVLASDAQPPMWKDRGFLARHRCGRKR